MNILTKFEFPGQVGRFSKSRVKYNGHQYLPYLTSVSNLTSNMGNDHDFIISDINLVYDDVDDYFKNLISSQSIIGSIIELMEPDGAALATFILTDYTLIKKTFSIKASNRYGELNDDILRTITIDEFPDADSWSYGKKIPLCYGDIGNGMFLINKGTVKCPRIATNHYAIHPDEDQSITNFDMFKPDGTDITVDCTIVNYMGIRCINYTISSLDYISADFETGHQNNDPQDVIEDILNRYTMNSGRYTPDSNLNTYLAKYGFDFYFEYYTMVESILGKTPLKDFCESYNTDWMWSRIGQAKIKWVDFSDLTGSATSFQTKLIKSFKKEIDHDYFYNNIVINAQWNDYVSNYNKRYTHNHPLSQGKYGVKKKELNAKWLKTDEDMFSTSKVFAILNKHPKKIAYITMDWEDYKPLEVGDTIIFPHPDAETTGNRIYQIRSETINLKKDVVTLKLWDYTFLENINQNIKLLIPSNYGDNYLEFPDMNPFKTQVIGKTLAPTHQDTAPIFGKSSMYFWGYRLIKIPDSPDWDIFGNTTDDYTIEMVLKVHDWSTTYATSGMLFSHQTDINNRWFSRLSLATQVMQFKLYIAGLITSISTSTAIGTSKRILTIIKKGGTPNWLLGLYFNGSQEAFATFPNTGSFAGLLELCGVTGGTAFLQSFVQEIRIAKENVYNRTPNVGLTDTFTPAWYPLDEDFDVSKTLTITNPCLTVSWQRGTKNKVKWNIPGCRMAVELWNSAMTVKDSDINTSVVNDGFVDWLIPPAQAVADYTIKVVSEDGHLSAFSDVFSITA